MEGNNIINMLMTWVGQIIIVISFLLALKNMRKNFVTRAEYQQKKKNWETELRLRNIEEKIKLKYEEIKDDDDF